MKKIQILFLTAMADVCCRVEFGNYEQRICKRFTFGVNVLLKDVQE